MVRGWGVFERGAVERSKSRGVVRWSSAVMRDDVRTCAQSRMTYGVDVGSSAGCEGGGDQKPYLPVPRLCAHGRVVARDFIVIDDIIA